MYDFITLTISKLNVTFSGAYHRLPFLLVKNQMFGVSDLNFKQLDHAGRAGTA